MTSFRDSSYCKLRTLRDYPRRTPRKSWSKSKEKHTQIRVGTRIVGVVIGREFVKYARASAHFLYRPPAIALDIESLNDAQSAGADIVKIIDKESGKVYRALISTIHAKGFPVDRGYGKQIALLLSYWSREDEQLGEQMKLWR